MGPGFLLQHLVEDAASTDPDRKGDRVAIHLPKGVETVAAVYGVLRAGAAYVPLDPKAAIPRVAGIAADCEVAAVIGTASRTPALVEALPHRPALAMLVGSDGEPVAADLPIETVTY